MIRRFAIHTLLAVAGGLHALANRIDGQSAYVGGLVLALLIEDAKRSRTERSST